MYHSPFHLIDPEILESGDDPVALKRRLGLEKRKLLAEFELAGTATIVVQGRELQRQDVTALFDELQAPEKLRLHRQIWQHKRLLEFLETGHPGEGDWLLPDSGPDDMLLRLTSPYYAEALDRFLQRCLQGHEDPAALLYELRSDAWLLPVHQDAAYRYAIRFFTDKKNELLGIRYRSEHNRQVVTTELRDWCNDQQIHVLNRLPDRFDDMRYVLAELLNNLCVLYDRKQAKQHALAAIERAATIRVADAELERLVPSNLRIIRNKNGNGLTHVDPDTGKRRIKILPFIILGIVLLRILFAGQGCFRENDEASYRPGIVQPAGETDRSPQEESFRSLIGALTLPQAFSPGDTLLNKPARLQAPLHTGDDPFSPLFSDTLSRAERIQAMVAGPGTDSSTILMRNNSTTRAIFLLQLGPCQQRSVYIAPGDAFSLCYSGVPLDVHAYAGHDWSDTAGNSFLVYRTSTFALRQAFFGGFRNRVPIAYETPGDGTPLFSRSPESDGSHDTLSLINAGSSLEIYYNLGAD